MAPSNDMKAEEISIHKGNQAGPPDLRLLHFNDVYHPHGGSEDPVGGIARFQTLVNHYRNDSKYQDQPKTLTFFSGDAFNPSRESSVTKGDHMVPVLNNIGIDAACIGNHEFDFGEAHFRFLAQKCNFPWMVANIIDPNLGEDIALGQCEKTKIITASNGIKVGVMALVEYEWMEKINNSLPASIEWKSMIDTAKKLGPQLREQGADIVIALTHARQPRDHAFGDGIPSGLIDIVLGGHDHEYEHHIFDNGTHLLRSGTDFKNLSYVEVRRKAKGEGWDFDIVRRDVVREIEEDQDTAKLSNDIVSRVHRKMDNRIGYTSVPLDARFNTVALKESNYGNFVADLMRLFYDSDCALVTAFTIRGDQVYPPGELLLKNIIDCFPFEDPIIVIKVTGQALKDALENGVRQYPEAAGCFPQVSNIRYTFDGKAEVGSRITNVEVKDSPLDLNKEYTIATRAFLASGKNGYETFRVEAEGGKAKEVVSEEEGVLISTLLRQYFRSLEIVDTMKTLGAAEENTASHWNTIAKDMEDYHPTRDSADQGQQDNRSKKRSSDEESDDDDDETVAKSQSREKKQQIMRKVLKRWRRVANIEGHSELASEQEAGEFVVGWTRGIAPRLDGRIQVVNAQA